MVTTPPPEATEGEEEMISGRQFCPVTTPAEDLFTSVRPSLPSLISEPVEHCGDAGWPLAVSVPGLLLAVGLTRVRHRLALFS